MSFFNKDVSVILVDWHNLASFTGVMQKLVNIKFFMILLKSLTTGITTPMITQQGTLLTLESSWDCVLESSARGTYIKDDYFSR